MSANPHPGSATAEMLTELEEARSEVDRLTRELADCEAHLTGARRDFEAASRVMLERHEAELAERTRERDDAHRDLAIVYGRNECGQRFPTQRALVAAARRVAHRNGWADPYPETPEEPKP